MQQPEAPPSDSEFSVPTRVQSYQFELIIKQLDGTSLHFAFQKAAGRSVAPSINGLLLQSLPGSVCAHRPDVISNAVLAQVSRNVESLWLTLQGSLIPTTPEN